MIARGCVTVDGNLIRKPGSMTAVDADIEVDDAAQSYVSRAALKLIAALDASKFDVAGKNALDLELQPAVSHKSCWNAGPGMCSRSMWVRGKSPM